VVELERSRTASLNKLLQSDLLFILKKVHLQGLFDGKVLVALGQFIDKIRNYVLLALDVCAVGVIEQLK
jgi:hypothetical protein